MCFCVAYEWNNKLYTITEHGVNEGKRRRRVTTTKRLINKKSVWFFYNIRINEYVISGIVNILNSLLQNHYYYIILFIVSIYIDIFFKHSCLIDLKYEIPNYIGN